MSFNVSMINIQFQPQMHKLAAGLWSICSCSELQNSQNTKIIKSSGGKDVKVNNIFTGKHEDLMRETKLNEIVTLMKQPLFKNLDKFSPPPKKKKTTKNSQPLHLGGNQQST